MELSTTLDTLADASKQIIAELADHTIILFEGDMGTGKTTLIKALCKQLGSPDNVSSPTFSLVNEYKDGKGKSIYHFDFYRLEDENEALDIGADEYFQSGNLCLIEWPTKIQNILPNEYVLVNLLTQADGSRKIDLTKHG